MLQVRLTFGTVALAAFASSLTACIDLTPDAPPPTRWLSIGDSGDLPASDLAAPAVTALRIGSIDAASSLDDRLRRRRSEFEVTYAGDIRWAEPPEDVFRLELEAELFQRRGFVRNAGAERTLSAELLAFDEVFVPRHEARVSILVRLEDDGGASLVERRFDGRAPITGGGVATIAGAMTKALRSAVAQVADHIAFK